MTTLPDAWAEYAEALGSLHAARQGAVQELRAAQRADAHRSGELAALAERLTAQRQALVDLAARLQAPLSPADLPPTPAPTPTPQAPTPPAPTPPAPGPGPAGIGDIRAAVDAADAALAEARHVATLPRLLPAWEGRFARAAVVYAAFGVPSLLLTTLLSTAGVRGNRAVLLWFVLVWPAVTALLGGLVVQRVSRPPLDGDPALAEPAPAGYSAVEQRVDLLLRTGGSRREPTYRWFGVLLAWTCWLVPGVALDRVGALWPG